MSHHRATAREIHGMHQDEINRVNGLKRHEAKVRSRAHLHAIAPLVQPPLPRAFRSPIPHRYEAAWIADHMAAPGSLDDTGFAPGCIV